MAIHPIFNAPTYPILNSVVIDLIVLSAILAVIFLALLIYFSLRKAQPSIPSRPEGPTTPPGTPPHGGGGQPTTRSPAPGEAAQSSAPVMNVEASQGTHAATMPPVSAEIAVASVEPAPITRVSPPVRIGAGIRRTRENFLARIRTAISGARKTDEIYEGLEEALIAADVGVDASVRLAASVHARLGNDSRPDVIKDALKAEIAAMLTAVERPPTDFGEGPCVIMLVGVNGVGKTTTAAKLAARMRSQAGGAIVAAADTFRAAAIEQLEVWCKRAGVQMIKHQQGSDPAAVAFDAVKAGVARHAGAVIIDTAGRLQTKVNLMEELKKIARVAGRELPGAPHETWLVLDANTGQNALSQAKIFGESVALTGVILAKLDSTAKGGVVVAIADRLKVPVRYVGLGEGIEDLREFDAHEFVDALFDSGDSGDGVANGSYAA